MEYHGKSPLKYAIAIIPARYASTRLPGKLMSEIAGRPLIVHTLEQVRQATTISRIIVATDDERILRAVVAAGGEAVMTSSSHLSGSDRIAEVAETLPAGTIIVNVQGDEPMISPETIDRAVNALLKDDLAEMSTTCEPITHIHSELLNGNVVKVVIGDNGYARHFSRSPMPFPRDASLRHGGDPGRALDAEPGLMSIFRKHTGLYAYRREYLLRFTKLPQTKLEKLESLEQLRALEDGARICVVESASKSIGVDTERDLIRAKIYLEEMPVSVRLGSKIDIPEISEVYVKSVKTSFDCYFPKSYLEGLSSEKRTPIAAARFDGEGYRLFIAQSSTGKIVGFADTGIPVIDGAEYERQLYSIYLLPEFQGLGIGASLFEKCVSTAILDGANSLCLDTMEISPYRRFYHKLRGSIVGKGVHSFGDSEMATVVYGWDDLRAV